MDNNMAKAQQINHALIKDRNVWTYKISTDIGDFFLTEHENINDPFLIDDYLGRDESKAEAAYHRAVKKLLNSFKIRRVSKC